MVIPVYNAGRTIGSAIESVLNQTAPPLEIIAVNDGSTDDSEAVIRRYGARVRYHYQENAGGSAARNTGIKLARGNWIAFLDADDLWLPDKLACQIQSLQRYPDLKWICTNYTIQYSRDNHQRSFKEELAGRYALESGKVADFFQAYSAGIYPLTTSLMVKRNIFYETGLFRHGQKWAHDTDLFLRIAYRYPEIGYLDRPLAIYRHLTTGGITRVYRFDLKKRHVLIRRHRRLSQAFDKHKEFEGFIRKKIRQFMYIMYVHRFYRGVGSLLSSYPEATSMMQKALMLILILFPFDAVLTGIDISFVRRKRSVTKAVEWLFRRMMKI